MEKVFNKLVRDNIPDIILKNGQTPITRVLNDEEYKSELLKKLLEETNEVLSSKESRETLEELSDVLEIIKSIAILEGYDLDTVINLSNQKRLKRGGFEKRIYLERTID